MSQSDTTRELRNMAEEGRKKPGCCRRHPVACGVTLLVVGALGLAVVGVALGVHPTLKSMFKKTVNEVGGETQVGGNREERRGGGGGRDSHTELRRGL